MMGKRFKLYKQQESKDCGPTCLRMIAKFHGRILSIQKLRELCFVNQNGATLLSISDAAEKIGLRTTGVRPTVSQIKQAPLPCILHWKQNHYVILHKIKNSNYYIADPSNGLFTLDERSFQTSWLSYHGTKKGVALLLSPSPGFYDQEDEKKTALSWLSILKYFYTYKRLLFQLVLGLGVGTVLSLIAPFLTKALVDIGLNTRDIGLVTLILLAQVMLFLGSTAIEFIRSWILLHVSARVNIDILTDFWIKLTKLPISFFESKTTGDIIQRMRDEQTIESFLTSTVLNTIFSTISLFFFTVVLAYYNLKICIVFFASTCIYLLWITLFLKKRKALNYKQFANLTANQDHIIETVNGIREIKLNNSEQRKRWQWEHLQAKFFKFRLQNLTLSQYQQGGALFISQSKNILITFLSIKSVINGQLTIGGMMAIQYIVGQLSSPIDHILGFIQSYQDAKISLERLNEIHNLPDEEPEGKQFSYIIPEDKSVRFTNVSFKYPGGGDDIVLENLNVYIPEKKTTAIVGMSGSGKTTLLKLLLRFYEPEGGSIKVGNINLNDLSFKVWRNSCGMVMQEGYIFSDSIAGNIALGEEEPDQERLQKAIDISNIAEYIMKLPFGLYTRIGAGGKSMSQGQKQRLLIARAVYKNPDYLFFDEATNSLDANNESIIMKNLAQFFTNKTVVIVAHRLSTVRNADNIIVLDKGKIIEQGTHRELSILQGQYYSLVQNQLEM